jgi:hypothetical protein
MPFSPQIERTAKQKTKNKRNENGIQPQIIFRDAVPLTLMLGSK